MIDSPYSILEKPIFGKILKRLRVPLLVLSGTYTISVIGFLLVPGIDDQGGVYRMSVFEAFYFVSFMGSTIGFGELPYPFTDAQRTWTLLCIYMTVTAWLYSITYLIALLLDDEFKRALTTRRFVRSVRRIREPFFLICGVDDTGVTVAEALRDHGIRTVGIDIRDDSVDTRRWAELRSHMPILQDDAGKSSVLKIAGLKHAKCSGVLALSPSDRTNLKIAITTRILNPRMPVFSRAETEDAANNMASFETTYIFNAYREFAETFDLAFEKPHVKAIRDILAATPGSRIPTINRPPTGRWIVCGYGRLGKAVCQVLDSRDCSYVIIETDLENTNAPAGSILARGTEEITLREARITESVGIIAATDDDTNNLSIVLTAANVIPDLFLITRQNENENDEIFDLAPHNMNIQNSDTITARILECAITPLAREFIETALKESDEWGKDLYDRMKSNFNALVPEFWSIVIEDANLQQLVNAPSQTNTSQANDSTVRLADVVSDSAKIAADADANLNDCIVLLRHRKANRDLLPTLDELVQRGDEYYLCGTIAARTRMLEHLSKHSRLRIRPLSQRTALWRASSNWRHKISTWLKRFKT